MKNRFYISVYITISFCFTSCVSFAPPSPLMTLGGPQTTAKKTSEAALGIGTGVALFDGAHSGAQGWFARYKYGVSSTLDLGLDMQGAKRNDGLFLSAKFASRYQLSRNSRLEFGIGVADDSDGKSLNGDFAFTIGTVKDRSWNHYSSLRFGYAKGVPGNYIVLPGQVQLNDSIPPPNTSFALINLGTQGRISDRQHFIFEGAYGYIFPKGEKSGPAFYVLAGLLFNIGNAKNP